MNKRFSFSLETRQKNKGFIFVAPWIIGFVLFFLMPFVQTVLYSFNTVEVSDGIQMTHAGFSKYMQAFTSDAQFIPILTGTIIQTLVDTPIILVFSLMAASLISRNFKGRWLVRLIFFLPVIYGTGVMLKVQQGDEIFGLVLQRLGTSADTGSLADSFLSSLGIEELYQNLAQQMGSAQIIIFYIIDASKAMFSIINRSGVQILLFLAALKSIPPHLYEVGKVEGASAFEMFWKVTLPLLLPHILTAMVFTIIDSFTNIENEMTEFLQKVIFSNQNYGLGSALSLIYFLCIIVLIGTAGLALGTIARRKGVTQ